MSKRVRVDEISDLSDEDFDIQSSTDESEEISTDSEDDNGVLYQVGQLRVLANCHQESNLSTILSRNGQDRNEAIK